MKFNHRQLTFVREYKGYSQTELAKGIDGLSQSNLSKFEKGIGQLSEEIKDKIINFLGFPREFYSLSIYNNVENAHYRCKAGISKRQKDEIERANKLIGRIIDDMADDVEFPEFSLKEIDLGKDGDIMTPENVADYVRKCLRLNDQPVKEICALLENKGIIIVEQSFDEDVFDGVSFITDNKGYRVIIINSNYSNDRKRFTIAHELGHIIMHLSPEFIISDSRDKEKEANRFASEFLMPEKYIKNSLRNLKLSSLMSLKQIWLTSMASIIRRASDLNCIDKNRYTYFNIELSRRGYKKQEPGIVYIDKPRSYYDSYKLYKNELNYSDNELGKAFYVPVEVIQKYCATTPSSVKLRIARINKFS